MVRGITHCEFAVRAAGSQCLRAVNAACLTTDLDHGLRTVSRLSALADELYANVTYSTANSGVLRYPNIVC